MSFDGKAFGQEVASIVKAHMQASIAPLAARLDAIERQLAAIPKEAPDLALVERVFQSEVKVLVSDLRGEIKAVGEKADVAAVEALKMEIASLRASVAEITATPEDEVDVKSIVAGFQDMVSAEIGAIKELVEAIPDPEPLPDIKAMVDEAVAAIPVPQDGKSVTLEDVRPMLQEMVSALPKPEDGKSVTVEDVMPALEKRVDDYLATIPAPKDGEKGEQGEPGKDGKDGRDGLDVNDMFRAEGGRLVAVMSDGRVKDLGVVVGKDGAPGQDGKDGAPGRDGFDLEKFSTDIMEDGRTVLLRFQDKGIDYTAELFFPVMIYRGVFKEGQPYEKGDTVTWGGSLWHCDEKTAEKPGNGPWTLCAKKGRDGKDTTPVKVT